MVLAVIRFHRCVIVAILLVCGVYAMSASADEVLTEEGSQLGVLALGHVSSTEWRISEAYDDTKGVCLRAEERFEDVDLEWYPNQPRCGLPQAQAASIGVSRKRRPLVFAASQLPGRMVAHVLGEHSDTVKSVTLMRVDPQPGVVAPFYFGSFVTPTRGCLRNFVVLNEGKVVFRAPGNPGDECVGGTSRGSGR